MSASNSISEWKYCFLFFLLLLLVSCNQNSSITDITWENLDSSKGVSFHVIKYGNEDKNGDVGLKYIGYITNNEFITDTGEQEQIFLDMVITPLVKGNAAIQKLRKGTTGFIKIDKAAMFFGLSENTKHYTLYFSPATNEKLNEDSILLAGLNKFTKIEITNNNDAVNKFSELNDTTWKNFVKENPLPESIDLTLRKEFLKKNEIDSVKNQLKKLFPNAELESFHEYEFYKQSDSERNISIYKFILF